MYSFSFKIVSVDMFLLRIISVSDPYDTLDRHPMPGHDSEIDSYLGEDLPGEFDGFGSDGENQLDSERSESCPEPEREGEIHGEIHGEGALRQMEKTEDQWTENDASSIISDSPEPEKVLDDGESDSYTTGYEGVVQDAGEREDTTNLQMMTTENIVNLQRLVTSLATQVTNLSSKVEDYDFKNGLLLRTVEIQQVGIRGFIDD